MARNSTDVDWRTNKSYEPFKMVYKSPNSPFPGLVDPPVVTEERLTLFKKATFAERNNEFWLNIWNGGVGTSNPHSLQPNIQPLLTYPERRNRDVIVVRAENRQVLNTPLVPIRSQVSNTPQVPNTPLVPIRSQVSNTPQVPNTPLVPIRSQVSNTPLVPIRPQASNTPQVPNSLGLRVSLRPRVQNVHTVDPVNEVEMQDQSEEDDHEASILVEEYSQDDEIANADHGDVDAREDYEDVVIKLGKTILVIPGTDDYDSYFALETVYRDTPGDIHYSRREDFFDADGQVNAMFASWELEHKNIASKFKMGYEAYYLNKSNPNMHKTTGGVLADGRCRKRTKK